MVNALITGGSSGVGEYLARRLKQDTSNQVMITGRNERRMQKLKDEIGVSYAIADVGNSNLAEEIVKQAISEMGSIDILVVNAGVGRFKLTQDFTDEDIDLILNTNIKGVFNYLRPGITHMLERNSGQIIATSSNLGFEVTARGSLYCASKHALQAIMGSLREELKGTKIKVATVNPGSIDTPWYKDYSDQPKNHRLDVEEVVEAFMLVINQGERSNIDHILLDPANQRLN